MQYLFIYIYLLEFCFENAGVEHRLSFSLKRKQQMIEILLRKNPARLIALNALMIDEKRSI